MRRRVGLGTINDLSHNHYTKDPKPGKLMTTARFQLMYPQVCRAAGVSEWAGWGEGCEGHVTASE